MRFLIILVLLVSMTSCQNEQQRARRQILKLEKQTADSSRQQLQAAYLTYVDQFSQDSLHASRYLGKAAAIHYADLQYSSAITLLYQALRDYYSAPSSADNLRLLYQLYVGEVNIPFLSHTLTQAAQRSFPETAEEWPLPDSLPKLEERLEARRNSVYAEAAQGINYQSANEFITAAELYALLLPAAEPAPEYLFSAAEIARGLGVYRRSLGLMDWIVTRYPDRKEAAQAAFLKAFTLDEQLRDTTAARAAYESFIAQFPEDEFVDDARLLMQALE